MKRLFLIFTIVAGASLTVFSVSAKNKHQHKDAVCMKHLELTEAQKEQLKALNDEYRSKMKELALEKKSKMNEILTPEQQEKMKGLCKESGKHKKDCAHNKLGKRHKLDSESRAKIKALREEYRKELGAIEKSRIAPEMQEKRKKELRIRFKEEVSQIRKAFLMKKSENKLS